MTQLGVILVEVYLIIILFQERLTAYISMIYLTQVERLNFGLQKYSFFVLSKQSGGVDDRFMSDQN